MLGSQTNHTRDQSATIDSPSIQKRRAFGAPSAWVEQAPPAKAKNSHSRGGTIRFITDMHYSQRHPRMGSQGDLQEDCTSVEGQLCSRPVKLMRYKSVLTPVKIISGGRLKRTRAKNFL
jgi:hypothetical protein